MNRFSLIIPAVLFFILFVPCCKKEKTEISPEVASNDEALYEMGQKYLKKDPEKARLYFRQLIDSFPKSFFAQRAKLAIADSYFQKGDEGSMLIAASEYREFISLYPYSPSAPYAQYQIAMTFYKKILKPGRDQTKTRKALQEFQKIVANYPSSEEAEKAKQKIRECKENLAEHQFRIGEFYYKRNAYKAAVGRLKEIITKYPEYSKMDKVYFLLGNSYYEWNRIEESIPYFTKLISDFPQSKFAEKAKQKMEEIEKQREKKK